MLNMIREFFYNKVGVHFDGMSWFNRFIDMETAYYRLDKDFEDLQQSYYELEQEFKARCSD